MDINVYILLLVLLEQHEGLAIIEKELKQMLGKVFETLQSIFSVWAVVVITICGAWSFLMVNPALAERGLKREAEVAKWGGLLYFIGGISIFLILKVVGFFIG